MPDPPLTLITIQGCPLCDRARDFFARRGTPVTELDYWETPHDFRESLKVAGETVTPIVTVGDDVHVGYDEDRWTDMLESPLPPPPTTEPWAVDFLDDDDDDDEDDEAWFGPPAPGPRGEEEGPES